MILINDDQNRMLKIHVNDRLLINIIRWYIATGCWWSYFQAKCHPIDFARWNNISYGHFQHVEEVDCYPNICDYGIGWKKFFNVAVVGEPIWDFEVYNFSRKVKHFAKFMHWEEIISWDWILMSSSTTASHPKLFEETFKVII